MAYNQVPLKHAEIEIPVFITHVSLLKMVKMPFNLYKTPSIYQRVIIRALQGLINKVFLAYLDNVIIFSKRRADHVNDLRTVLDRIRDAKLKHKPAKFQLICEQILYLGHVISAAGVFPDLAKLRALADWPKPTTVLELQSFFKFVNFNGNFIDEQTAPIVSLYD